MTSRRLADPQDQAARFAANARRARIEGPGVWLEALATAEKWGAQPEEAQDQAAVEMGRRLGSGWSLRGIREWSCDCALSDCSYCPPFRREPGRTVQDLCRDCVRRYREAGDCLAERIRHRLALFEHRATGIEFSLVPGGVVEVDIERSSAATLWHEVAVRPLLVARGPVTKEAWYRGLWADIEKASPNPGLPVTQRSHKAAGAWAKHNDLRLPSVAEWTHAARGGAPTRFPWGDEVDLSYVWCAENSGAQRVDITDVAQDGYDANPETRARAEMALERLGIDTIYSDGSGRLIGHGGPRPHPPAEHDGKHNAFGLVDTVGNVWEWLDNGELLGGSYNTERERIEDPAPFRPAANGQSSGYYAACGFRPVASIPGLGAD